MKIWSNFNHSKVPNYQMVKVFNEKILWMNLSFCISYILSSNNKLGMWINIIFSIFDVFVRQLFHFLKFQKSITTNKWIFYQ